MAAIPEGGRSSPLRPADLLVHAAMGLLLLLMGLVWVTRRAGEDVETLLSLMLGTLATLAGYHHGQKDAAEAKARAEAAGEALREMQDELRRAREELAEAKTVLAAALSTLAEISPERKR